MLEASAQRQLDELDDLVLPGFVSPPMLAELGVFFDAAHRNRLVE